MTELLFLIPLVIGIIFFGIVLKIQIPKGTDMNRSAVGIAMIVLSLLSWLSCAILIACFGKFVGKLEMIIVIAFFVGLAFFVPQPANESRWNQHGLFGNILIGLGIALGLIHAFALDLYPEWSNYLYNLYTSFGLKELIPVHTAFL